MFREGSLLSAHSSGKRWQQALERRHCAEQGAQEQGLCRAGQLPDNLVDAARAGVSFQPQDFDFPLTFFGGVWTLG